MCPFFLPPKRVFLLCARLPSFLYSTLILSPLLSSSPLSSPFLSSRLLSSPLISFPLIWSPFLSSHLLSSPTTSVFFIALLFFLFYSFTQSLLSSYLSTFLSFLPPYLLSYPPSFLHPRLPICHVLSRTVSSLLSTRFLLPYCVSSPPYSPLSLFFVSFSFSFCTLFLIINHHCSHNSNYFKSNILVFHI